MPHSMKRDRRRFTLCGMLLACAPAVVAAQASTRVLRVALLNETTEPARRAVWKSFVDRLAELGYVVGRNLTIEARYADGVATRLPALAAELVEWKPDVLVVASTPAALAARDATSTTPVVFVGPADPVASGLVSNLGRPGGNVTGISPMQAEIGGKWIEILRDLAPDLKRAAYLTDTGNGGEMLVFDQLKARASSMGVAVQVYDGVQPGALERAFAAITGERCDGLVVALTLALMPHRDRIVQFAALRRMPAVYARREYPDAGGLLSYGADAAALFRRTADYVDRIAQGARPADLPVERPTLVKLVVNQRTARAQGIRIPASLLVSADEVID